MPAMVRKNRATAVILCVLILFGYYCSVYSDQLIVDLDRVGLYKCRPSQGCGTGVFRGGPTLSVLLFPEAWLYLYKFTDGGYGTYFYLQFPLFCSVRHRYFPKGVKDLLQFLLFDNPA